MTDQEKTEALRAAMDAYTQEVDSALLEYKERIETILTAIKHSKMKNLKKELEK